MSSVFSNFLKACLEIWNNIGIAQKTSIVLITLVTFGVVGGVIYVGAQPDWQVLYTGLEKKQASKIYEMVRDENVKCELKDSGTTILVPSKDVYRLRLLVAKEGIDVERTGEGWAIFDKQGLGTTQKQQQINEQRALQGELERMISGIPGVSGAQVMLAFPEQRVFRLKGQIPGPTASVMVALRQGRTLGAEQINSIRYMVSSAVRGMKANDVTITDSAGNLLAKQVSDGEMADGGDVGSQFESRSKMERNLQEKAESILRPIVGPDSVVAVVSCAMVFDQVDTLTEMYDGDKAVPKSERVTTNDMKKSGEVEGGRAGVASNMTTVDVANPEGDASLKADKSTTETQKTQETEYLIPKTTTKTVVRVPRVKGVTVAVTVAKRKDKDGKVADWSAVELASFKSLVVKAVGAEGEGEVSGANVEVVQMDFVRPVPTQLVEAVPMSDNILFNVEKFTNSPLVKPVFGLALLLLLYRVFKSYFSKSAVEGAEISFSSLEEPRFATHGPGLDGVTSEMLPQNPVDMIKLKSDKEPAAVAGAIESWLAQEKK